MPYRLIDDSDGSFRDFFFQNIPDKAGLFNVAATPKPASDFDKLTDDADTKITQDHLLDKIAKFFVEHSELDKARELVDMPSLRSIIATGFIGQCFKEFQHPNALGPVLAAGLLNGAENRDKIIDQFDTKTTKKIVSDLTELTRVSIGAPSEDVLYENFHVGARRLFVAGVMADMMQAIKTEYTAKQNNTEPAPEKRLDLTTTANFIMREAYSNAPVVYDRGEGKLLEKAVLQFNALATMQGFDQRLHWDGEMVSRRKAPPPKALPPSP